MAEEIQHSRAIQSNDAALTDIRIKAETALTHGARDKAHAFHLPALATISAEGTPMVRHIILRAASPGARTLHFYTDSRSQKVIEIGQNPDVNLVFYDPNAQVQLRVGGVAKLVRGEQAKQAWRTLSPWSPRLYGHFRHGPAAGTGRLCIADSIGRTHS
ncbi:MAG: pyridoxamine 5'-phosphate oxidase family protein [Parvibaculaceae bacterium]|nr:pyridoxamine 5'-phosphate oxidase family protein [Parvibaculaceae bacterium]